jgi:hypothetical protein
MQPPMRACTHPDAGSHWSTVHRSWASHDPQLVQPPAPALAYVPGWQSSQRALPVVAAIVPAGQAVQPVAPGLVVKAPTAQGRHAPAWALGA